MPAEIDTVSRTLQASPKTWLVSCLKIRRNKP